MEKTFEVLPNWLGWRGIAALTHLSDLLNHYS